MKISARAIYGQKQQSGGENGSKKGKYEMSKRKNRISKEGTTQAPGPGRKEGHCKDLGK